MSDREIECSGGPKDGWRYLVGDEDSLKGKPVIPFGFEKAVYRPTGTITADGSAEIYVYDHDASQERADGAHD